MSSHIESSTSSTSSSELTDKLDLLECPVCGQQFDDMALMQRHMLTEHIQKGDLK